MLQWATLATLLRQADVCLRLLGPLETADLWLLSHLTNLPLFVVNLLKFHLTAFKCSEVQYNVVKYTTLWCSKRQCNSRAWFIPLFPVGPIKTPTNPCCGARFSRSHIWYSWCDRRKNERSTTSRPQAVSRAVGDSCRQETRGNTSGSDDPTRGIRHAGEDETWVSDKWYRIKIVILYMYTFLINTFGHFLSTVEEKSHEYEGCHETTKNNIFSKLVSFCRREKTTRIDFFFINGVFWKETWLAFSQNKQTSGQNHL